MARELETSLSPSPAPREAAAVRDRAGEPNPNPHTMDKNSIKLVPLAVEGYRMEYPDGYSMGKIKGVTEADAREIARRWNAHIDLVKHLDGLLVQLEDTGDALDATIIEARQMLEAHGYDDKALGELIDENH